MAKGTEENKGKAPRRNQQLPQQPWTWIAAGAFMGMLAGAFFLLSAMVEFQNQQKAVCIGYLVLMVVFSFGTFAGAWFLGRKEM